MISSADPNKWQSIGLPVERNNLQKSVAQIGSDWIWYSEKYHRNHQLGNSTLALLVTFFLLHTKHVPGFNVPQFIRKLAASCWLSRIKLHGTLSKSLLDNFNFCDRYLNDMCSNCLLPKFLISHPGFNFWLKCNVQTVLYLQNRLTYASYRTMPEMV